MYALIITILLAHFLGDFVFQSNKMINDIAAKKIKSPYLYIHIAVHFLLIITLTGFKKEYFIPALLLSLSHLAIDIFTKIYLKEKINAITKLLIDQALHLISISIFIYAFHKYKIDINELFNTKMQLLIISIICLTIVTSVIIKKIIESLNYEVPANGLKNAGKYIGMLERIFVFIFIINNFWEGIGFLLAAKSIFRFGDLKKNNDLKLTEYILIGTLLSFGMAIFIGKLYLNIGIIISL